MQARLPVAVCACCSVCVLQYVPVAVCVCCSVCLLCCSLGVDVGLQVSVMDTTNDISAMQARAAAVAALNDITGRVDGETSLGGVVELGGRTLCPGLYSSTIAMQSECVCLCVSGCVRVSWPLHFHYPKKERVFVCVCQGVCVSVCVRVCVCVLASTLSKMQSEYVCVC